MNLDLFDTLDGAFLSERENYPADKRTRKRPENNNAGTSRFPAETPLAMAYVPYQIMGEVYDDDAALCKGTLFPELDFPFKGGDR